LFAQNLYYKNRKNRNLINQTLNRKKITRKIERSFDYFLAKKSRFLGKYRESKGINRPTEKFVSLSDPQRVFLVVFWHLAKEESQSIQPTKEEFANGILWIQGSDL
jgi:hypothetical protein